MEVHLQNVRLSFPKLWEPVQFNGKGDAKFEANFLLHKKDNADEIKEVRNAIKAAIKQKWGSKPTGSFEVFLRDGEEKDTEGYQDSMFFVAKSRKRPTIVDRDKTPLVEEDGKIYAGCYVNAVVSLWCQDNDYGKAVRCNLSGVQFVKDGDSFGSAAVDANTVFADISAETAKDIADEAAEDDDDFFDN
jgi:hypothetical protein